MASMSKTRLSYYDELFTSLQFKNMSTYLDLINIQHLAPLRQALFSWAAQTWTHLHPMILLHAEWTLLQSFFLA